MVTKKPKGLGRGLEALLGPKVAEAAVIGMMARAPARAAAAMTLRTIAMMVSPPSLLALFDSESTGLLTVLSRFDRLRERN